VLPAQIGLFDEIIGADGEGLITMVTVLVGLVHPLTVTLNVYVPLAAIVTLGIDGF
jgi:hypothetical protein